jgi:ketosteroid isomerase-like protein
MAARVRRSVVTAYYQAFATRDPDKIAPFLAGDVDWMIVGPVDLLRFCGQRRGKAAVLELFRRTIPDVIHLTGFVQEVLLVDKDRAASYGRLSGIRRADGRTISYRYAHFLRFEDDKLAEFRSVIDSFDAAEQVLGHPLDLSHEAKPKADPKVVNLVPA